MDAMDLAIANGELVKAPNLGARLDARFAAFEARMDARFAALEARIDAKFARAETRQILWTLTIVVGNSYLPQMARAISAAIRALYRIDRRTRHRSAHPAHRHLPEA